MFTKEQLSIVLKAKKRAYRFSISDLIFSLLPALILFITRLSTFKFDDLLTRSDWSYVALILFGQALIKFIYGVIENRSNKSSSTIVLIAVVIFCLGCIPTALILVLIEISTKTNFVLVVLQHIMLVLAMIIYFIFNSIGQILCENKNITIDDILVAKKEEKI